MSFLHFIRKVIFLTNMYILKKAVSISLKDLKSRGYEFDEENPILRMKVEKIEDRKFRIDLQLRPPPARQ